MHFKRGRLEIQYIILLILAVIVLITMIYIFRSQISLFVTTVFDIGQDINASRPPIGSLIGE